jgi:signal transduction histidine kinase
MAAQSIEPGSLSTSPAVAEVSQLVGALSHDLAANLMVLESSLKRLKKSHGDYSLSDIAKDFAQVDACLRESQRFLDDLRQLSRSGQVQLTPSALKLEAVVRGVVEEQASAFAERKVRVEIAASLPAVWCNESRLKQVLTNLLRNAVLHGCDAKAPRIAISATAAPGVDRTSKSLVGSSGWIWIRVHDNGRGIPAEHHQSVFLPGKRLESSLAPGTGLGLAIVAQTVAQLGGKVWIDAELPGTAFVFSVPAAPAVVMDKPAAGLPEPHLFRSQASQSRAGRAGRRLSSPADSD